MAEGNAAALQCKMEDKQAGEPGTSQARPACLLRAELTLAADLSQTLCKRSMPLDVCFVSRVESTHVKQYTEL